MSVNLSPIAPRYAVSDADDPFKKYWWAILLGIVFTGLWLLLPMMGEKSVGATAIDTSKPKADANVEQSFASADAGNGIDLSMDGTGHKRKEDGALGNSLYMAPPEETAATGATTLGSATAGASGTTLASALKKVSESGGWNEKAQKGFSAPKLAGGSLSGMGAASGGKAGSASGGSGAFGSSNANVGFGGTRGLSGSVKDQEAPGVMAALKSAAGQSVAAANNSSNDAARSGLSGAFDGAKAGSKIGGNGAALSGGYAALDSAPMNLKLADPKLNEKKLKEPPSKDDGASAADDEDIGKQLVTILVGAVLSEAIGGIGGTMVSSAVTKMLDNEQKKHELKEKQQLEQQSKISGGG